MSEKRIAVLSDIHGNSIALQAVLTEIDRLGPVDEHWILGDLAAIGPDPIGVLEVLSGLPAANFVRGNTDRYVATGDRPQPTLEQAAADPRLLPALVQSASSFSWTQGALAASGWLDWIAALPLEMRTILPDGTRVLCVHASPGRDDSRGLDPALSENEIEALFASSQADLVLLGHTHWAMEARLGATRLFNPGSVSNPLPPDLRASFAILQPGPSGHRITRHRVEYDRQAVIDQAHSRGHPAASFIQRHMQGKQRAGWMKD